MKNFDAIIKEYRIYQLGNRFRIERKISKRPLFDFWPFNRDRHIWVILESNPGNMVWFKTLEDARERLREHLEYFRPTVKKFHQALEMTPSRAP